MLAQVCTGVLYKIGGNVPQAGNYVCVPCGYVQYFEAGNLFTTCDACFAGTDLGPEGLQNPNIEFWEFLG